MEFKSVNKILQESFVRNWDRAALTNYQGMTLAYRDVARRISKLHIAFEQCGLRKGDKVAICSRNQANWGVSFLAALTYGAVAVPILHEFKPGNIHYLVNHSEARVLFVDEVIWEGLVIDEMPDLAVVVQINNFKFLYAASAALAQVREHLNEEFGHRYPDNFEPEHVNYYEDSPEELAIINYTSGTSGFSKGVMIPYRALYSNIQFAREDACPMLKAGMNVVSMLPTAHMYGMMFEFLFEMTIGMHVHFLSRVPSPKIIMQAFSEIHPDIIIAVPLVIEKVYKNKLKPLVDKTKYYRRIPILGAEIKKKFCNELTNAFGGRFEEVILGGAAFNPEVEKFLHSIGFHYTVGYGMTECAPIIGYAHWDKVKVGSAGRAALNMEIRISSPDPRNIPGEVQVKGPNVCLGYYKNPDATRDSFTEDGWFRTGDMGILDQDGYLFLRGRSKCMVLGPSGQNIYPEELEATINNFTYVVDSLVVEDDGGLTALIYPDWHQGELDGMTRSEFKKRITDMLPAINQELPNYAQIKKIELMPEDFERTPKKSIKRYLYQR
ncbi:MAG: AMP-binding protein [Candidatus Cryptobacteroides sp.]|nr:AMP-binding protein [Candidatus Cryptobacteroides sp.]